MSRDIALNAGLDAAISRDISRVEESMSSEPPWGRMKKRPLSNPRVTCGSCRRFDGYAWCHHWNFHTEHDSPICDHFRPRKPPSAGDVAPLQEER